MIRVDKTSVVAPSSLTSQGCHGEKELSAARLFYATWTSGDKGFSFAAYKGDDVVNSLQHLFHGKCAYCESRYTSTQPVDVEHYRPKGGVEEAPDHGGYWWLAMKWENLLPSCIDCNRRRKQVLVDQHTTLVELELALLQKGDVPLGKRTLSLRRISTGSSQRTSLSVTSSRC